MMIMMMLMMMTMTMMMKMMIMPMTKFKVEKLKHQIWKLDFFIWIGQVLVLSQRISLLADIAYI